MKSNIFFANLRLKVADIIMNCIDKKISVFMVIYKRNSGYFPIWIFFGIFWGNSRKFKESGKFEKFKN
jgi:hypothetical protein